jgi:ABC-type amino acid transport substrate-binding protein
LINLVVTNGNTTTNGIVPGLTIGVLNGSTPHNLLKKNPDIQLQTYNDLQSMLFGLIAGQVDGIVSLTNTIVKLASDAGIEEKIKVVGKPGNRL